MKCIVTGGPAYEELDEVRRLTNFSTGTLGAELAKFLVEQGHEVQWLRGHYATCRLDPAAQGAQVFTTTAICGTVYASWRTPGRSGVSCRGGE